jgi:hypothetical protein
MINTIAFDDLRNFMRQRITHAKYRVDSTWHDAEVKDISTLTDGTVRVKIRITTSGVTVNRVAIYNQLGEQWAYQDCTIQVETGQTGILFWFDLTLSEFEG